MTQEICFMILLVIFTSFYIYLCHETFYKTSLDYINKLLLINTFICCVLPIYDCRETYNIHLFCSGVHIFICVMTEIAVK